MTDVELDERVTALEEKGGVGGNNRNGRAKIIDVHQCFLFIIMSKIISPELYSLILTF